MRSEKQFVDAFEQFWRAPSVDALDGILAEDVVLRQPLGPTTRGLAAGKQAFSKIFKAVPDLRAVVDRWAPTEDGVFIEFRLMGTVGGRLVEWPVVDRFVLRDGIAIERIGYFDPTPLLRAVLTRPMSWGRFLRSRFW
jgi:ketosteroid isomerase-like protein